MKKFLLVGTLFLNIAKSYTAQGQDINTNTNVINSKENYPTEATLPVVNTNNPYPQANVVQVSTQYAERAKSLTSENTSINPTVTVPNENTLPPTHQTENIIIEAVSPNIQTNTELNSHNLQQAENTHQKQISSKENLTHTPSVNNEQKFYQNNNTQNLSSTLTFSDNNYLTKNITTVVLVLSGLGLLGAVAIRIKKGKFYTSKQENTPMEIISSLSIHPKRQILLLRVRDQEMVIASTEQGVTFLTDIIKSTRHTSQMIQTNLQAQLPSAQSKMEAMLSAPAKKAALPETTAHQEKEHTNTQEYKQEMLLAALKNLKSKAAAARKEPENENVSLNKKESIAINATDNSKKTSTQQKGVFPKYLANSFEKNSKMSKETIPEDNEELAASSSHNDDNIDSVESVTKMIREKLKNLNVQA